MRMERNRGTATVGVTKLLVRTALTDFYETESLQKPDDLLRLQNRN